MIDDAYIVVLAASLERTVAFNGSLDILLNQGNNLPEVFVESNQDELQALGLVLGSIFALPLYDMEEFAI